MKVRLLLAKAAEVQSGLLYGLGIGWTHIGPDPSIFAIAALVEVSWDETNRPHRLTIVVVDTDGHPLLIPTATGDAPFQIEAVFNVGRPPDAQPGQSFTLPVAVNVPPLPFQQGRSYVIRALVDGERADEATVFMRAARPPA